MSVLWGLRALISCFAGYSPVEATCSPLRWAGYSATINLLHDKGTIYKLQRQSLPRKIVTWVMCHAMLMCCFKANPTRGVQSCPVYILRNKYASLCSDCSTLFSVSAEVTKPGVTENMFIIRWSPLQVIGRDKQDADTIFDRAVAYLSLGQMKKVGSLMRHCYACLKDWCLLHLARAYLGKPPLDLQHI